MADNPFADLIPNNAPASPPAAVAANPFGDLMPAASAPQQEAPVESNSLLQDLHPVFKAIAHVPQNLAAGMATGGQNIETTVSDLLEKSDTWNALKHMVQKKTGISLPRTINMEEQFGINDENRQPLTQAVGQYAPLLASGNVAPAAAGYFPTAAAEAAAGGAYGLLQDPENPLRGGLLGAGGNAVGGVLGKAVGAPSKMTSAAARAGLGGLLGYAAGGMHGAEIGAGAGLVAPKLLEIAGLNKNAGKDVAGMVTPAEVKEATEAGARQGVDLSPGEASGRLDVIRSEAGIGRTGEGATQRVETSQQRLGQQKEAIKRFKGEVSPASQDAAVAIRDAAKQHLEELRETRKAATAPYYKAAEQAEIPQHELDTLLQSPRIKSTYRDILNDQDYLEELGGVQPTGKHMIAMIENRIDGLIGEAKSKPYNGERIEQLEHAKRNLTSDYQDPRVQSVLKEIYEKDPVFHAVAQGINPRSIKLLDLVQDKIGREAENLASGINPGKNKYKAGLIGKQQEKIKKIADQYSAEYNEARARHAAMSPEIERAENSILGRLANLKDTQLKQASSIIFDPAQTNLRVLADVKRSIMRRNPQAWDAIVRNHLDAVTKKGNLIGSNFYRTVLENDNHFNQLNLALDHNPKAQETLADLRTIFKNITNPNSVRGEYGKASTGMLKFRESIGDMLEKANEAMGSKAHAEAVKYLYSPRWVADVNNIKATKSLDSKKRQATLMLFRVLPPSVLNFNPQGEENAGIAE